MRSLFLALLCFLLASSARADVQRFAVIIGNNVGHPEDHALAYAESDADKIYGVLRELGGFQPINMVLLKGESSKTVRSTLIAMNDRIRTAGSGPGSESVLVVYYSGHADASALRLGKERVELTELAQLVRGSAATFRLMVLDACRSGQLTRLKGGRMITPFSLPSNARLSGEGLAFLTASAASEDAQESDELRGSFFTHALVSGLLGAADADRDGGVVLEEAYRYAYDATLRATSRTAYGVQHPSFDYDFRGQGSLVLTRPGVAADTHGAMHFPASWGFLVMRGDGDGPVVAELAAADGVRALSLRAGQYFLRGRGPDYLVEGSVTLAAAQDLTVELDSLRRVQYARLVRKGASASGSVHAVDMGAAMQAYAPGRQTTCWGASVGYTLEFERLSAVMRLGTCSMELRNDLVSTQTTEYDGSLAGLYTWDFPLLSLAAGLAAGATVAYQRFETLGRAPSRTSTSPYVGIVAGLTVDLAGPVFMRLDARAATEFTSVQTRAGADPTLDVTLALRAALLVGMYLGAGGR